ALVLVPVIGFCSCASVPFMPGPRTRRCFARALRSPSAPMPWRPRAACTRDPTPCARRLDAARPRRWLRDRAVAEPHPTPDGVRWERRGTRPSGCCIDPRASQGGGMGRAGAITCHVVVGLFAAGCEYPGDGSLLDDEDVQDGGTAGGQSVSVQPTTGPWRVTPAPPLFNDCT